MGAAAEIADVAVIGAGQAGLEMGRRLQSLECGVRIFERNRRIGDSWRRRFDSLTLFSPREFSALSGLPLAGDKAGFPAKDEIADYLEAYADHFGLPVVTGNGVARLRQVDGGFALALDDGTTAACRAVVIAAGAFQQPSVPAIAQGFSPQVVQLTADDYRNPSQLPTGTVLVVGDGATGRQIALELCRTHRVVLATGRRRTVTPYHVLGRSHVWWMEALGLSKITRDSAVGRFFMRSDPFPGLHLTLLNLRCEGASVVGRLNRARGVEACFARGAPATIASVVWATGYRDRSDWVEIPAAKNASGQFIERRGIAPVPNLFFIGRNWQWTRASALIFGVRRDVEYLIPFIREGLQRTTAEVCVC